MTAAKFPTTALTLADVGGEMAGLTENEWTLDVALDSDDLALVVNEAIDVDVAQVGWLTVDNEIVKYSSWAVKTFTLSARGQQGTTAAAHDADVAVGLWLTKQQWNQIVAEIIALETQALGGIHNPNLVLNSDFARRTVLGLAMPEVFADTAGVTTLVGTAPSVASNILTAGAASAEQIYTEGLDSWRDARYSATFKLQTDAASAYYGVGKVASSTNHVFASLSGGATDLLSIDKVIAGTPTNVASIAFNPTVNRWYWIELEAQGTTYIAKLYDTGGTVPGVTKASSTLVATVTGTVADAAVVAGKLGIRTNANVTTAAQWGGIATGNGGVYVETWLPESWLVGFGGTLGGQAVGYDEAVDAGPIGRQLTMRVYIPATGRTATLYQNTDASPTRRPTQPISPSTAYTQSMYVKTSGASGSGGIAVTSQEFDAALGNVVGTWTFSDAQETSWTRKTVVGTTTSTARFINTLIQFNPNVNRTGTFYVQLGQIEQGSTATAWRNAPDDSNGFGWLLEKDATSTTTSTSFVAADARDYAINAFLPFDATVDIELSATWQNSGANNMSVRFTVDGVAEKEMQGANADGGAITSVTYCIRKRLAAGKHRIELQWKTSAGTASLFARTAGYSSVMTVTAFRGK